MKCYLESATRKISHFVRDDKFVSGKPCHLGGTGTTVPHFLHVRSFSSLENF